MFKVGGYVYVVNDKRLIDKVRGKTGRVVEIRKSGCIIVELDDGTKNFNGDNYWYNVEDLVPFKKEPDWRL